MLFIGFAYEEKSKIENVFQEGLTVLLYSRAKGILSSVKPLLLLNKSRHQRGERWTPRSGEVGGKRWATRRGDVGTKEGRDGQQGEERWAPRRCTVIQTS